MLVLQVLRLVLLMLSLLASRGPSDDAFRRELAEAIATVTDDPAEEETLVRIARYESGYRRNVAACDKRGDKGKSLGTFQVQPMTPADRRLACGTLLEQAGLALRYVRRSSAMCPENRGAARLNLYVSGRCDRGFYASSLRWGGGSEP